MSFKNKVVLVTGSSSGIGANAVKEFAKQGADIVVVGRNENKLSKVTEEISKIGNKPTVIKADVSQAEDAKRIIDETISKYGKLDVLINNAGIMRFGSVLDSNIIGAYDETMATNVRAAVNLTSLASPHLIKSKGNIINMSSIGAESTPKIPSMISYNVSNAALNHFSRGAALELAEHGVRVNVISPGPVNTLNENAVIQINKQDFALATALKRISEPIEIVDLMLFLASDKAKGITGSVFVCDNGMLLSS